MFKLLAPLGLALALIGPVQAFELTSPDLKPNARMSKTQEYKGFGCEGDNLAPALAWTNAPKDTKSFAITVYDPDAPSGSGWWHWIVYDIPASMTGLLAGAGTTAPLPTGLQQGRNDYGAKGFGGACPPKGDKAHHYVFTVFALKVDKLDVPADASAALIGFMLNANALGKAKFTTLYQR